MQPMGSYVATMQLWQLGTLVSPLFWLLLPALPQGQSSMVEGRGQGGVCAVHVLCAAGVAIPGVVPPRPLPPIQKLDSPALDYPKR